MSKKQKKEVIEVLAGAIALFAIVVALVAFPKFTESWGINHAQAQVNKKAPAGMEVALSSVMVEEGDTVTSIAENLYDTWGEKYDVSVDTIYYWILDVNGFDNAAEASDIKAGLPLLVPTYIKK